MTFIRSWTVSVF
ncbi:hypothetical protein DSL72_005377 [Monilinia vaccinii-corymbosi]|uniref:Uncharacterized protein n=1 Tax=Monilinia vaccinii-corymbosi TaxID=61207 RepID=A0A8A3PFG6_9HELO|nr:hypothetical protein DSL72_005377 [Monilinia vaccinii-corymbosi]